MLLQRICPQNLALPSGTEPGISTGRFTGKVSDGAGEAHLNKI